MATIKMKSKPPILTKEELKDIEAAEAMPVVYDEDCPEMTTEKLEQFVRPDSLRGEKQAISKIV